MFLQDLFNQLLDKAAKLATPPRTSNHHSASATLTTVTAFPPLLSAHAQRTTQTRTPTDQSLAGAIWSALRIFKNSLTMQNAPRTPVAKARSRPTARPAQIDTHMLSATGADGGVGADGGGLAGTSDPSESEGGVQRGGGRGENAQAADAFVLGGGGGMAGRGARARLSGRTVDKVYVFVCVHVCVFVCACVHVFCVCVSTRPMHCSNLVVNTH